MHVWRAEVKGFPAWDGRPAAARRNKKTGSADPVGKGRSPTWIRSGGPESLRSPGRLFVMTTGLWRSAVAPIRRSKSAMSVPAARRRPRSRPNTWQFSGPRRGG